MDTTAGIHRGKWNAENKTKQKQINDELDALANIIIDDYIETYEAKKKSEVENPVK